MSIPRRRLTYTSKALLPVSSRIEKPRTPVQREVPVWVQSYQNRLEEARREYLLLKDHEEPEEALEGQGEVVMAEANTDLVQEQLSELAQQVMHVIQACNEEKEIIEDDFESVKNNIRILETRIQTERQRIDSDVSGVSTQSDMQQAMLKELRFGIHILQTQDNQIVDEASQMFQGMKSEMEAMSKRITANSIQLLANQNKHTKIQDEIRGLTLATETVNKIMSKIKDSLQNVPSRQELRNHAALMDEQTLKIQEVNTGLTTAMEGFKVSESSRFNFRPEIRKTVPFQQAGPSVHPERQRYFGSDASSLRDTESEDSWLGRLRGGAGEGAAGGAEGAGEGAAGGAEGAGDGAAGGAEGAGGGAAGNAGGAGDPPPPGSNPPSDHFNNNHNNDNRMSRRQRRIRDLQYAKPIKIKEPKGFEGKIGDRFEDWWVMMEVYIQDQPEKFPNDRRTIDWIGSLMDKYAQAWHIQWIKGTISGKHPKSITGYVQALKLRFEDRDDKDEAYALLEKVRYDGCIRDMFTKIQMFNDRALVTGAALKKIILDRLPHKILEQMHTVDLTGKTDEELITIITNAGRTAEKWDEARKNLGLKIPVAEVRKEFGQSFKGKKETRFDKPKTFKKRWEGKANQGFKGKNKSKKTYAEQTEGIDKSELDRRKAAGECQRCAWPGDRKGAHNTMDCFRWARKESGTAPFPKAKEYQKLKVGAYDQESEVDLYTTDDSEESEDSDKSEDEYSEDEEADEEQECLEEEEEEKEEEEEEEEKERNWWDSDSE